MISLSTPPEEILKELFAEEQKAVFWLKKYYHGDKGYEKMRDGLIVKCLKTEKTAISDVVEYISPNGNRWMAFECCQYYKKAEQVNTVPMAFCYYETYGSVGAYLVGKSCFDFKGSQQCVLHFTNHFFLRFCQRLGVEMRSRWMVQRFVEVIPGFLIGYNGKDEQGRNRFDVRLPASIGRGIMIPDAPIVEIRTYLTDKELNGKQLRETEKLRRVYDMQTFEPYDVKMGRLARSKDFAGDVTKEIDVVSEMSGIDRKLLIFSTNVRMFIAEAIIDLGYIDVSDRAAWKRFGERTSSVDLLDFVTGYDGKNDTEKKTRQLYDAICKIGELSGIKGYDPKAVMEMTIENWKKALKEHEE